MKKLVKISLSFVAVILLFFLLSSFWLANFVDINDYKSDISAVVFTETGLNLDIKGDLQLSLLSGLKFNARNAQLSLGEELIADIDTIKLGLTWASLFSGEPEISSLNVHLKTLRVYRDKYKQFNFLPLVAKALTHSQMSKELQSTTLKTSSIKALSLKNVSVSIEEFHYLDDLNTLAIHLQDTRIFFSTLPIISDHQFIIHTPKVLRHFIYKAKTTIAHAFVNQYQLANLKLVATNSKGVISVEELAFHFLEEGKEHAKPPIKFTTQGSFLVRMKKISTNKLVANNWGNIQLMLMQSSIRVPHLLWLKTGQQIEIKDAFLMLARIALPIKVLFQNTTMADLLPILVNDGLVELKTNKFYYQHYKIKQLALAITGTKEQINLAIKSAHLLGSTIQLNGVLKPSRKKNTTAQWQLNLLSKQINLQQLSKLTQFPFHAEGVSSFTLFSTGIFKSSQWQMKEAKLLVKANNVHLDGINVNAILEEFQNSQSVGLLDVGAVVLLGPAGVLLTKGNDYKNLLETLKQKGGQSRIKQLNMDVNIADDWLTIKDVAFATPKHRLAVKGSINLTDKSFKEFHIATVNHKGCSVYEEKVTGSLNAPKVAKANVLVGSVLNPIHTLVSNISEPFNISCKKPFYTGQVQAP